MHDAGAAAASSCAMQGSFRLFVVFGVRAKNRYGDFEWEVGDGREDG